MTSSTLATTLGTITSTWQGYFTVMITNWWPYLIGAIVVVAVLSLLARLIYKSIHT